jgi:hypothetical protein
MFIKKLNNKSDVISGANEFIKLECSTTPPFNFPKQFAMFIGEVDELKSYLQNRLFHSLLKELWTCGVSSYDTYEDLRNHYKELAGLITYKKVVSFEISEKSMIYKAIKLLPLKQSTKDKIYKLLKGEIEVHHSWSEVSKSNAKFAIDALINDCNTLGAYACSSKVKTIIDELNNLDNIII